jgi:hypothetical protein
MPIPPPSSLDANQVLQHAFDDANGSLRVSVVDGSPGSGGGIEIIIDHTEDSVRIGDGSKLVTATNVGGKTGLDVNIANPTIEITATDLDIRNIDYLFDDITTYDPTLSVRIDEVNKNLIYIGKATIGSLTSSAVWQIQRVTTTGSVTATLWADGNANFDNIWDNRAVLTYV